MSKERGFLSFLKNELNALDEELQRNYETFIKDYKSLEEYIQDAEDVMYTDIPAWFTTLIEDYTYWYSSYNEKKQVEYLIKRLEEKK